MQRRRALRICLTMAWFGLVTAAPQAIAQWDTYCLYLGDWPSYAQPGWHESPQGLAHDSQNWFITNETTIWKVPVGQDLSQDVSACLHRTIGSYPQLAGYNHFGDPECYVTGPGFLVVPVEGKDPLLLAFLDATDLSWIGSWPVSPDQGTHSAWVAFDDNGYLYASGADTSHICKYYVNWPALLARRELDVQYQAPPIQLLDADGNPMTLGYWGQGGAFSEDGQLFYLIVGRQAEHTENDGINVFDAHTWRHIGRSSVDTMPFQYGFSPGFDLQEPEGLTVWNLDGDVTAPRVSGQLHVMLYDGDWDNIWVKHYSHTIHVDASFAGVPFYGRPDRPYRTVTDANNLAWEGSRIRIAAGVYPETLSLSKRVEVTTAGGLVQIGAGP